METFNELGSCILPAAAPEQLHEPEHAAVLIRETSDCSARRAISQHGVDGALKAFFLAHRTTSCLTGKRHREREVARSQADLAGLIVHWFLSM